MKQRNSMKAIITRSGRARKEHPANGAAGVRGGRFIARLRALLAGTVVDQGIRKLSE